MKHHETVVIRCDDIGARCGDVCVWGSDIGDRAEVIRCDNIGTRCGDIVARCGDVGAATFAITRSYWQYRRGVSGYIGDCGVGITPQMCNRVTNHGDMSTFSKPATHVFFKEIMQKLTIGENYASEEIKCTIFLLFFK